MPTGSVIHKGPLKQLNRAIIIEERLTDELGFGHGRIGGILPGAQIVHIEGRTTPVTRIQTGILLLLIFPGL